MPNLIIDESITIYEPATENRAYSTRGCSGCGLPVASDDLCTIPGGGSRRFCCPSCANSTIRRCRHCDISFPTLALHDDGEGGMFCRSCCDVLDINFQDQPPAPRIHGHSYAPHQLRFSGYRPVDSRGLPEVFCGYEHEVETCGACSPQDILHATHEILGGEHFFCKRDGSLTNGVEIVSHPFVVQLFPFDKIRELCARLQAMGARSYQPGSCGLHVHVSRYGLNGNCPPGSEIERNIWRGIRLLRGPLFNLSRRQSGERTDRYCRFPEALPGDHQISPRCPNRHVTRSARTDPTTGRPEARIPQGVFPGNLRLEVRVTQSGIAQIDTSQQIIRELIEGLPVTEGCECFGCRLNRHQEQAVALAFASMDRDISRWLGEEVRYVTTHLTPSAAGYSDDWETRRKQLEAHCKARANIRAYLTNAGYWTWPAGMGRPESSSAYRANRYQAVNFLNNYTVEVRFFRGTLHGESAVNSIKFAVELIRFLSHLPASRIQMAELGKLSADNIWFDLLASLAAPLRAWVLERSMTKTRYRALKTKFRDKIPTIHEYERAETEISLLSLEQAS